MTAILSSIETPLEVLRADLDQPYVAGTALFANGDRVRFTYRPKDDHAGVTLYMKPRENDRFARTGRPNPRPSAARVEAIRKAVDPLYRPAVEEALAAHRVEAAENERRDLLRANVWFQTAAGPLLFAVLDRIAGTADISELLDDEPELAADLSRALAAGRGETVDGRPLPVWQYRPIGADYFSGVAVRAPDEATARLLASAELRDGRDKFGASRSYLPEEIEVRERP